MWTPPPPKYYGTWARREKKDYHFWPGDQSLGRLFFPSIDVMFELKPLRPLLPFFQRLRDDRDNEWAQWLSRASLPCRRPLCSNIGKLQWLRRAQTMKRGGEGKVGERESFSFSSLLQTYVRILNFSLTLPVLNSFSDPPTPPVLHCHVCAGKTEPTATPICQPTRALRRSRTWQKTPGARWVSTGEGRRGHATSSCRLRSSRQEKGGQTSCESGSWSIRTGRGKKRGEITDLLAIFVCARTFNSTARWRTSRRGESSLLICFLSIDDKKFLLVFIRTNGLTYPCVPTERTYLNIAFFVYSPVSLATGAWASSALQHGDEPVCVKWHNCVCKGMQLCG